MHVWYDIVMKYRYGMFALVLFGFVAVSTVTAAGLIPCDGPECQACHFVQLGQKIITWLVSISAGIIALMFAWGGMQFVMSAGSSEGISKGKAKMTDALIGFVILLASWLIVDTFLKMFMSGASYGVWNEIQCVAQPAKTAYTPPGGVTAPPATKNGTVNAGSVSHGDALSRLESVSNINVTSTAGESGVKANCSGSGCTTLEGIREQTVGQVLAIASACPECQINVVGATEGGVHSTSGGTTHANGYKIDIDDNQKVDAFFISSLTPDGSRGGDPRYKDSCGNTYVRESTHWDITVSSGTCSI